MDADQKTVNEFLLNEGIKPNGKKKKIRIHLSATTYYYWSTIVEVPEKAMDNDNLMWDLVSHFNSIIDSDEYEEDSCAWDDNDPEWYEEP